jgi:hypothetical protein
MMRASMLTAAQCATYDEAKRTIVHHTGWVSGYMFLRKLFMNPTLNKALQSPLLVYFRAGALAD